MKTISKFFVDISETRSQLHSSTFFKEYSDNDFWTIKVLAKK